MFTAKQLRNYLFPAWKEIKSKIVYTKINSFFGPTRVSTTFIVMYSERRNEYKIKIYGEEQRKNKAILSKLRDFIGNHKRRRLENIKGDIECY